MDDPIKLSLESLQIETQSLIENFAGDNRTLEKFLGTLQSFREQTEILNNVKILAQSSPNIFLKYGFESEQEYQKFSESIQDTLLLCEDVLEQYKYDIEALENKDIHNPNLSNVQYSFDSLKLSSTRKTNTLTHFKGPHINGVFLDTINIPCPIPKSVRSRFYEKNILTPYEILRSYKQFFQSEALRNKSDLYSKMKEVILANSDIVDLEGAIYLAYLSKPDIDSFISVCFMSIKVGYIVHEKYLDLIFTLIAEHVVQNRNCVFRDGIKSTIIRQFEDHVISFFHHDFPALLGSTDKNLLMMIFMTDGRYFSSIQKMITSIDYKIGTNELFRILNMLGKQAKQ